MLKHKLLAPCLVAIWILGGALSVSSQPATTDLVAAGAQEVRSLAVVRDGMGNLWAAWEADSGTDVEIYFSRWTGEGWQTPQPVHGRPQAWDRSPSLAVTANGELWLAWSSAEKNNPELRKIYVSRWTGQRWTDPEAIPLGSVSKAKEPFLAAPAAASHPALTSQSLETDGIDRALWLAWVGFDGVDDEIFVSRWNGESWQPAQQVSANDYHRHLYDRQPQLSVAQDGQAWVVWTSHQDGSDDEICASHWTGHGWTPEQTVSDDDSALDVSPTLALDAQDQPWVAWTGRVVEEEHSRLRILVSHWDADRSTWADEIVASSHLALDVDETSPALALHSHGEMHLGWLVSSVAGTALAHVRMEGGQWTEPQLVTTGLTSDDFVLTFTEGGLATFLHLPSSQDARAPVEQAIVDDETESLADWIQRSAPLQEILTDPVWDRYLAFGDSITWGQYYDFSPYSSFLDAKLDNRVQPSEVINSGAPGERTHAGIYRLKEEVPLYRPEYVLYMEGTNDVTAGKLPSQVRDNIEFTIVIAKHNGVDHLKFMVATLIPRKDGLNDETEEMNELAVIPAAQAQRVPVCDQWQAYYDYGPWQDIYVDSVHPDQTGLQLLADTFYDCLLDSYEWLHEDTEPPTTWIASLPTETVCGQPGTVTWTGTDNLSWVVSYDVQKQVAYGAWTDWLLGTQLTSGNYVGYTHNLVIGFRVRGRDVVGNQSVYSAARYTTIVDRDPPYDVWISPLEPVQKPPFEIRWLSADACSQVSRYEVEVRVGPAGDWTLWQIGTHTSALFGDDEPVEYGQIYYFRVRAYDEADNWTESLPVSTILAQFTLGGSVFNIRHKPVAGAEATLIPAALDVQSQPGGYLAFLAEGGNYDLIVERAGFRTLPAMHLPITADMSGVDLVLPPLDNVVHDGDFEPDAWDAWQAGGTFTPTLITEAHTGSGIALLGGLGELSWLSQPLTVPGDLTNATLSFLIRLDDDADVSSTVQIELGGMPISYTHVVSAEDWSHVWIPLDAAVGQAVTLTFTVSGTPAVRLDEVSLGSALSGGFFSNLPLVLRARD